MEERKRAAHNNACRLVGVTFTPLVMESLGGWSDEAICTISQIGDNALTHPQLRLQDISSRNWPTHCGEAMLPSGYVGSLPSPSRLMDHPIFYFLLFPLFLFCHFPISSFLINTTGQNPLMNIAYHSYIIINHLFNCSTFIQYSFTGVDLAI